MPCNYACSVIPTADVLETDQWTIGYGETALDFELQGAYYGMLFKIKGKRENHVTEKKKALNKEDK
jgi:hypothetical protein